MSLIKNNNQFSPKPVQIPTGQVPKAKVEQPKSKPVEQAPRESFVSTVSDPPKSGKTASETTTVEAPVKKLATPRPGSDMALMLEDMESAKLAGGDLKSSANGTLFVTQEGLISMGSPESRPGKGKKNRRHLNRCWPR